MITEEKKMTIENEQRAITLLKAIEVFLTKVEMGYNRDAMLETAFYDNANCDGHCLLENIKCLLDDIGEV